MERKKRQKKGNRWGITLTPILRYSLIFCLMILVIIGIGGAGLSLSRMRAEAKAALTSVHAQTSQRIEESFQLLEALASLPEFYDPTRDPIEKVKKLDQMSPYFGYLMICYVDADITVYSDGSEPASLASREYMQWLFSTGERQITDSFAAGADGVTLNYTVAMPLIDQNGNITGCLFCAIYFDEIVDILRDAASINNSQAVLIGSQGQIMSSTQNLPYGDSYMEELLKTYLFGVTADQLQSQLLAAVPGEYWSFKDGDFRYTLYQRVDNTNWDILCTVSFWDIFIGILPILTWVSVLTILLCGVLMLVLRRYIAKQMKVVDNLVHSVEELEKRIYQDECPQKTDFREILRLTSDGLSDSLTGVVTRTVFLSQAEAQLKKLQPEQVCALCFVDLDNLKHINDNYGHSGGDIALKSVGYILREYEKKYNGVVGRYGGDEFVLLLTDLESEQELREVLEELVMRLHTEVASAGERIPIQCSIGVSIYQPSESLEELIADADESLYFVKQNGKGDFRIHKN